MGFDRNAESDVAFGHKPVLLDECLNALAIKPDGIYVDGTLGRAGHSLEIAKKLTAGGRLICLDRDETAIEAAKLRLADYMDRVTLVHSNFSRIDKVLRELDIAGADGMLFDLGVSSPQLDEAQRGFSCRRFTMALAMAGAYRSSPYANRILRSSSQLQSFTTSRAVRVAVRSIRISRGASCI